VVLGYAAATGAVVVVFTLLAEAAIGAFRLIEGWGDQGRYLTLLWTPALTVALVWWTRRFVPGAAGSGIPQVMRALQDDLSPAQRAWLVSLRVSLHKMALVSVGLLA
jgi:H+/Cl- antiporter ClcA